VERFDQFYQRVYPRVSAALVVGWSDRDLAADAADEAFVRAYASWDRVSRMSSPDGWVFKVALNLARRQWRRDRRRRQAERNSVTLTTSPAPPRGYDGGPGSRVELAERVKDLPERQRMAVILRHVADLREDDIAEAMGIRRGTVASLLTTAHRSLRRAEQACAETS
jgi:RNA polymerase sigma factor (sigma-70 family)